MIVNVGLRRMVGAIQRLFNSSSFFAPLTHSLALTRGAGAATYTRASPGTVSDNEGVLRTAIAGEARFTGARRVRNLFAATGDITNTTYWTRSNITFESGVTDPLGGTNAFKLVEAATTSGHFIYQQITSLPTLTPTIQSIYAKAGERDWLVIDPSGTGDHFTYFNLSTGTVGTNASGNSATIELIEDGWYRCGVSRESDGALVNYVYGASDSDGVFSYAGDITKGIYIFAPQLEDITGRTDQTTPSEYVSVGVLSAPYHGAGVDGVKCFNTDLTGAAIPAATNLGYLAEAAATNLCLQSQTFDNASWTKGFCSVSANAVVAPDGTTTADKLVEDAANSQRYLLQNVTTSAGVNSFSVYAKAGERSWIWLLGDASYTTFDLTNGVIGAYGTPSAGTITSVGNGWYRCTHKETLTAAAHGFYIGVSNGDTAGSYQGNGTSGVYVWGAQVELG